ncbi:tail fiber assembly protein [Photorhabdus temperata]|uniref:tail fiber assembly protein n=1 Tax=Photorhabdus temperata TaxID=574560 RepID=UPI000A40A8F7|nr:tail fiber assembly protein [Photorhabdus temperata]
MPDTLTFNKPPTDFDTWNGKEWVVDKDLLKAHQINDAKQQQAALLTVSIQVQLWGDSSFM